ncbi:TPR domain protein [Lasiosphaeria ovina]|uniref:TPR domain protein n=1 Tax=Lasiosphaeria ovina TaxID=92902 RepID=A0AAE0K3H8_9PEZI|nr:TPR domain protein [Lasiosphaeria ovina]
MDTHDLELARSIQRREQTLGNSQARKGQRPARPPRSQVVFRFQLTLMASRVRALSKGPQNFTIKSSFVPLAYVPCVAPLSALKKTMIDDLLLETHHRGTYLLARAVTPQDCMTAVMAIVEDEKGDVLMAQLYHQDDGRTEDILAKGMVLIIKEPYFKLMSDGGYGLRVDHLSDVVFLAANDERIPGSWQEPPRQSATALAWKEKGNDHVKESSYRSAIMCYTRALGCAPTPEEMHTIRLNRSLAFLKTQEYDAALSDAEFAANSASSAKKPVEKALFRKAQALYSLERYRECCEVLKELRLEYPDNTKAKSELTRAISRLAEQTYGKYPFRQMYAEAASLQPPHLDRATYLGPVAVQPAGSRGRGLFTTRAVKAGDLLFCEKAFAHAFVDKEAGSGCDITMLIDPESGGGTMGSQSDLINMTVQKLYRNPSLLPLITDLHHGAYQPVDTAAVDGQPVVDTFLIRRIIALNCFGCPRSTLASHQHNRSPSTSLTTTTTTSALEKEKEKENVFYSCGLWPTASYINHSCASNARRSFVGDMMVARATRDLPPGAELTWWYQLPWPRQPAQSKSNKLHSHWGFACACALCADDQATSPAALAKRESLAAGLRRYVSSLGARELGNGDAVADKIKGVVDAMAATYGAPASEVPRLAVWMAVQGALVKVLKAGGPGMGPVVVRPVRMVELLLAAFAALGFVIDAGAALVVRRWGLLVDGVVDSWLLLRDACHFAAPELVPAAEGYAKTAYRMVFGEDETFDSVDSPR